MSNSLGWHTLQKFGRYLGRQQGWALHGTAHKNATGGFEPLRETNHGDTEHLVLIPGTVEDALSLDGGPLTMLRGSRP